MQGMPIFKVQDIPIVSYQLGFCVNKLPLIAN